MAGLVPARWTAPAGHLIGRLTALLAGRERNLARRHLEDALSVPLSERRLSVLLRGLSAELGRNAVEMARLLLSPERLPEVEIPEETRQVLDAALAEDKGVVYVTGHIGNWELMALCLARAGYPISTVAKSSYDPRFTRYIARARKRFGVEVIHRGDPGAPKAMLRALKRGRILGFLMDQDTDVPSVFVPFFGRPAHTPTGPALIALRTGAPSVVGTIRRTRSGAHRIEVERVEIPGEVRAATACYTSHLERRIRQRLSQWVWFHRRWRRQPKSEAA